ncbi:MAG: hypothetical protein OCD00_15085 [Colwellia sp.]
MSLKYKRHSKKEIARHLKNQVDGELSITAYCKKHKLVYQTFCSWKKTTPKTLPTFVQIEVPVASPSSLEIKLPNGIQARVDSETQIELIAKLMQVSRA